MYNMYNSMNFIKRWNNIKQTSNTNTSYSRDMGLQGVISFPYCVNFYSNVCSKEFGLPRRAVCLLSLAPRK